MRYLERHKIEWSKHNCSSVCCGCVFKFKYQFILVVPTSWWAPWGRRHLPTGWLTIRWYLQYLGSLMRFISSGQLALHVARSPFSSSRLSSIAAMLESWKRVRLLLQLPQGVFVPILGARRLVSSLSPSLCSWRRFWRAHRRSWWGVMLTIKASLASFFLVLSTFEISTLSFLKSVIGPFFPWLAILSFMLWDQVANSSNVLRFMPWKM